MIVLILGSSGFIGQNLRFRLSENGHQVLTHKHDELIDHLATCIQQCDIVVDAAGVSRTVNENEVSLTEGNVVYTKTLLSLIGDKPLIYISTLKTNEQSPYGKTKLEAERLVLQHLETCHKTRIIRLGNVFGKWAKPNHNSVIATFCHAINRDLAINVNENSGPISFIYIDEVLDVIFDLIEGRCEANIIALPGAFVATVPQLARIIRQFHDHDFRFDSAIDPLFLKYLYATYVSYMDPTRLLVACVEHRDARGSFTELFHDFGPGQTALNIAKPGIVKGGHYHHTKHEKYLVVSGKAIVRLRSILDDKVFTYELSPKPIRYIHIPPGYTHEIVAQGKTNSKTLMWSNELYDETKPDTHVMKVNL